MNTRITIDMTPGEAIVAHGRLVAALADSLAAHAKATPGTPEADVALTMVRALSRVTAAIGERLYPECLYLDCESLAVADGFCRVHRDTFSSYAEMRRADLADEIELGLI